MGDVSTQDRAPAFQFYAKDWLADPKVRDLSWSDKGRYIDLLASMWEYGTEGDRIPRGTAERLYGKPFVVRIADGATALVGCEEWDGVVYLFSNRLNAEASKLRSRSLAAKRSAEARWEAIRNADA